jgi:hypothetical protein
MLKFDMEPKSGNGNFIRLDDGDSVTGILAGEVRTFYSLFVDGKSEEVPEDTPKAKFRFRVNIVVKEEDGTLVPKLFEQGANVYRAFKELAQDYDLEQTLVKIKRTGSKMSDTKYSVLPLPTKIAPETFEKLAVIQLLPLESEASEVVANGEDGNF